MIGPDPTDALAIRLHMCLLNQLYRVAVKRGKSIKVFGLDSALAVCLTKTLGQKRFPSL